MTNQLLELIRKTSCELPQDIRDALAQARLTEQTPCASAILETLEGNVSIAAQRDTPLCQDTGTLTFFWTLPYGTDTRPFEEACHQAVAQATVRGWLRQNTIDALSGHSIPTNVAGGFPILHFRQSEVARPMVTLLMKGGGSENMSRQYSLPDARLHAGRDLAGVRACVLDAVVQTQGQGCAPGILGVAIGCDRAGGYALAKQQLLRPLSDVSPVPELAELERQLLAEANTLGIGPMGTGGATTVLGVKLASGERLPASYFVTVAYMCWCCRRQTLMLN